MEQHSAQSHQQDQCHHDHQSSILDKACCTAVSEKEETKKPVEGALRAVLQIEKMDCPTEERLIRNRLEPMSGIERLDFSLMNRQLTVYHHLGSIQGILDALEALDMPAYLIKGGEPEKAQRPVISTMLKIQLIVSGISSIGAEIFVWMADKNSSWIVIMLALIAILSAGIPTLKKGWVALKNMTLNIYFLMTLAVSGAIVIGHWPEAAVVVFLFALAEAIEALSLEKARNAIKSLTALTPEMAWVKSDTGWIETPVEVVAVASKIRIRTGEQIPLDATIYSGRAALNQAAITGESLPVDKEVGDALYAGSVVMDGVIEAEVTAVAGESTLARIAKAVQDAQSQRAPTQRFVDKFAHYYTPVVVSLALLVALLGPVLLGGTWSAWLYEALVLLVIACPCALVVSTPVTVVSGLATAAKHGILIKGGAYLEAGRLLKVVALDKTGTLTEGKPVLTNVEVFGSLSSTQALTIAASLDDRSSHPVAKALVEGWQQKEPEEEVLTVDEFAVLNGRGVKGEIKESIWYLGNHRLVEELGICSTQLETRLEKLENTGKTAIVLCSATEPVAVFAVADKVRTESRAAVQALKRLDVHPVMLTGDNSLTAQAVAHSLNIEDTRGNLLPEDKQSAVAELSERLGKTAMVGDGVNDAPALARADIGIAMAAAGTATALETADVAIMDDDPRKIAEYIDLSRKSSWILKQNISLALLIKLLFLILALTGDATLWMAVFADMGASLLVVFNGMRLLRYQPSRAAKA